jgi:hypothetical protein
MSTRMLRNSCFTAMAALVLLGAIMPASEAATTRRTTAQVAQAGPAQRTVYTYTDENGRRRTKIIVQRRSYLDAGTWVLPGQRHYTNYVQPPYSSPFDVLGPGKSGYDRNPLSPRWEAGGPQW